MADKDSCYTLEVEDSWTWIKETWIRIVARNVTLNN